MGALSAFGGIGLAWLLYVRQPGTTLRLAERYRRLHDFLAHKWYFDELYDRAIVRPTLALGAWSSDVFERFVVGGFVSGRGARGARGQPASCASPSPGCCATTRCCSMTGVTALALYFLVVSR